MDKIDQNKCNYCEGIYSQASNLARHYKACQEKQKYDQKYQTEIVDLKHQNALLVKEMEGYKANIERYKADIKIKDCTIRDLNRDYIDSKNKEVEFLKSVINNAGDIINTMSCITSNNASMLLPITYQNITNKAVNSYTNKILDTDSDDIIVAHNDQLDLKQMIVPSDVSRLTNIMRTLINNKVETSN